MRFHTRPFFQAIVIFSAPLALAACGSSDEAKPKPTPVVGVIIARSEPVQISTDLAGRTEAYEIAEVRPQVAGIVMARLFQEGSYVR
ncbi:MAG: efflux transporter periplasmic adaptor subunit, partial [Novosphingobium sp.]|nr:efflux transporter periplasmic adaptor subunit [Novosphingobium sp.]